ALACGQAHEVIRVGEDFLRDFARYAERTVYLTDGCASADQAADLFVNERARTIAPVRMTGNYGSEILRGVRAFKATQPPGVFDEATTRHARDAATTYAGLLQAHPLSFAVFRQAPWHHYGLLALEETQLCLRSPFLDNEVVRTVYRAPKATDANGSLSLRLIGA